MAPARDLAALRRLVTVIRDFRPAIVHTHSSKAGVLGRIAARIGRVPVVVHSIHGFGFTPLQPAPVRALFVTAEKVMSRLTDHFIAVSEINLREGVRLGLFERDEVSVIRSGVTLSRFRNLDGGDRVRQRLGIPAAAPVVVQVGNFKPQKAPLDFVRMAGRVSRVVSDAWFVMVGDGSLRPAAEELAAALGIADRTVFTGWWDDVPGLLAAARVSVLSSRHEGLPRAAVESLAAGVPVVATAVDGTPEVVHDGVNGCLVAAGDVAGLADRVIALSARRGSVASAGRRRSRAPGGLRHRPHGAPAGGSLPMASWPQPFLMVYAFVVGLVVGSFLNVLIHRVPRRISIVSPGSRVPALQGVDPVVRQRPAGVLGGVAGPLPTVR